MKKVTKIVLIIAILILASLSTSKLAYAATDYVSDNPAQTTTQTTKQTSIRVSDSSSSENELLSPTNIINIALIAVGIVLILLAIAIFIRLKK